MDQSKPPRLTYKVQLPGGQTRLREAALYVMKACAAAEAFGLTKLNKILWRADFRAFASRGVPVTGRQYQRLSQGPAPVEMFPLLQDMQTDGVIEIEKRPVGSFEESRPCALVEPSMRFFSADDVAYLDKAIADYWAMSGREVSKDSHGVAWETRANGDPMPYDLALLSDDLMDRSDKDRFSLLAIEHGWRSE